LKSVGYLSGSQLIKKENEESAKESKEVIDFQKMKTEEVLKILKSDFSSGLKGDEAKNTLKQHGYNEVPEKKTNSLLRFVEKFWGPTAWMLEVIIILSWILQRYFDVYIVAGLLSFNSISGFWEEQKASSAVEALKRKLQINARVLRDCVWITVPARELVPGDIVRIRYGDFVPADVKIITGDLMVDQSALTGESLEVKKKSDDLLYSGSVIKRGEASGIIVSTGVKTYFGKTVQLVQIARPKLHMEEVITNVVKWLLIIVIALLSLAIVFSALREIDLLEVLPLILVLLLSAIPVALPAMFTVSMALGSQELVKKGVLVTRLSASEDAATMDILCADKTGTITMNKLSLANVMPLNGFDENEVILCAALASQEANQDPIDLAFITYAKQKNLLDDSFAQKNFVPFDPETRRTEALVQKDGQEFRVMKGAVSEIAQASGLEHKAIRELEAKLDEFAKKGYRTLAVAKTNNRNQVQLLGLATLHDTPRPDSKHLIHELSDLGISVKMLTGDALPIAREIAKDVGLEDTLIKASDLKEFIIEDPIKAVQAAEKSDGFAEVFPEDKYTIVKSLQAKKHVVGMTGDGVNDALALRQAEVGIAVSNANDVAKGAASVVLINEGLTSIVDLVKNGRIIYQRISAWILSKVVRTLQIASLVVLSFLLTGNYIVSAFAIILLFFMTDFVKISFATDNQRWSKEPNVWNIRGLVRLAVILSLLIIAESFGLLYLGFRYFLTESDIQALSTFTFEILFYSAMFLIFNVREKEHFWNSLPSKTLLISMILSITAAVIIATVGIPDLQAVPITETSFVIVYSAAFSLTLNDWVKFVLIKRAKITW
jgi:H+-transporting ATPase